MTLLLIAVIAVAALALCGLLAWLLRPRPAPPERPYVRTEECDTCGQLVTMDDAHLLTDVEHDRETGGGTAMVATYCADHCPGGCNRHHERTSA